MSEIILVRHGQANSHATTEEDYDRLSDLGREQARWLGAHLQGTNPHFDRVITGTLSRQQGTAQEMGYQIDDHDPRLDELQYFALAAAMEEQHGIPAPKDPTEFATHLPQVLRHWEEDGLEGLPERFDEFSGRVTALVDEIAARPGRTLLVTSGGVIGMVMRHALGLTSAGTAKVMLTVMNSSLHKLTFTHNQLLVNAFNATPHLDHPDRAHARTYI